MFTEMSGMTEPALSIFLTREGTTNRFLKNCIYNIVIYEAGVTLSEETVLVSFP